MGEKAIRLGDWNARKKTLTLKKAVYLPIHEVERMSENEKRSILTGFGNTAKGQVRNTVKK